jgi:hypothetical protein
VLWNIPSTSSAVYIDAANQSSSILVTFAGPPAQVLQYPFDSVSGVGSATLVASGTEGHFSPDDSKIVYRVQTKTGWNLVVKDLSSGSVKTIQTGIGLSEDWGG